MSKIDSFCKLACIVVTGALAACSSPSENIERLSQAQTLPESGFVPYPILVAPDDQDPQPILAPDGSFQPDWDGTLADLMAADAYADCRFNSTAAQPSGMSSALEPGQDEYLAALAAKMGMVKCVTYGGGASFPPAIQWRINRGDPACNADPRSGNFARVEFDQRAANQYWSFSQDFGPTAWGAIINLDAQVLTNLRLTAASELEYADLNLCMAQRLRSQLNGGQSLFLPGQDMTQLLAVIRERAQLAIVYYGLLAKVFSSNKTVPTHIDAADYEFLILIRKWAQQAGSDVMEQIGEDFATAVRLHLDTTYELAKVFERQAGARPIGESGFDRAERDWGNGQPRLRLLSLLYGGDPIGKPNPPYDPGRTRGATPLYDLYVGGINYVTEDMRDANVRTLLGLARANDALLFKVKQTCPYPYCSVGLDAAPSAERMYRTIEVGLRQQACELETPGDPGCDPQAIEAELPDIANVDQYLLWQQHRVEPDHAQTLANAFAEAFGNLLHVNAVDFGTSGPITRLHLFGAHQTETIAGEPWVHVDPDFSTGALAGHEIMGKFSPRVFLPKTIYVGADARAQGFVFTADDRPSSAWNEIRKLGAVGALAFVREAIVEGSGAGAFAAPFFTAASAVLPDIERAVGKRSAILRPKVTTQSASCQYGDRVSGASCKILVQSGGLDQLEVTTHEDDPLDTLTTAPDHDIPGIQTVAIDPGTTTFDSLFAGIDRADLDGYTTLSGTTEAYTGFADGYERRSFEHAPSYYENILLRGDDPNEPGAHAYMWLFEGPAYMTQAKYTSFGGDLHNIGQRTLAVLSYDWSRPAFDAFGFPVDWVPPADASLVGGNPGEPSYSYYLRAAKDAAGEATAAVQKAIDNLVEETQQTVQLEAAEQRAETISEIERRTICGPSVDCEVEREVWSVPVGDCSALLEPLALSYCQSARVQLVRLLPGFTLAQQVVQSAGNVAPSFPEFEGGEIQRVLVRQWNAKLSLVRAAQSAMDVAVGVGLEYDAAADAETAAEDERDAAVEAIDDAIGELDLQLLDNEALLAQIMHTRGEIAATVGAANEAASRECGDDAYYAALQAGESYSDVKTSGGGGTADEWHWDVRFDGQVGWSPGPLATQFSRCQDAQDRARVANATAFPATRPDGTPLVDEEGNQLFTNEALNAQESALVARNDNITAKQTHDMVERREAAESAYQAALSAVLVSRNAAWSQFSASLTQVQQAVGELLAASVELSQVQLRLENALASANLERDLTEKEIDTRFGLQRKFRSYDMWRARALIESARRIAVAARRSIEAHFVVDLSELQAQQAFVEAPAVWADEVYGTDLDAPSVVGLSIAPEGEPGAIFPNQLIDYVGNLERFVQGYTVSYPTSVASPDTEVVTLPGPELTETVEIGEEDPEGFVSEFEEVETLSGDSLGWSFFCPDLGQWLGHPGTGQVPLTDRLATLCDTDGDPETPGIPPTRMRYSFSLDPWARLNRSIGSTPLVQRHNVRWRRLAVNLVGTGIRDCELAADPLACFSESFLRFQLVHSGPAWATNHAQQWRAFDLPAAFIEGGKSLATEEWLDPIANTWTVPSVANVARGELFGRPVNGAYELIIETPPETRFERIDRVQLLVETDYWVRQQ